MNPENDIEFLSNFLDEGIYVSENQIVTKKNEQLIESKPLEIESKTENKISTIEETKKIVPEIKKVSNPTVLVVQKPTEPNKTHKKVIILVSYPNGLPSAVSDNLHLTFNALAVQKTEIEILNVTIANPTLLDLFSFDFLVLMGGKGKTLNALQNYTGNRDFYEVGVLGKSKIIFVEKMDTYMIAENKALKVKYWETLKKAFGKA